MGSIFSIFWTTPKWRDPAPDLWTKKMPEQLLAEIKTLRKEDRNAHILLCGPTHAGKSALMNSLFSICENRLVLKSHSGSTTSDGDTLTKTCKRSSLPEKLNYCCITDTPGILENTTKGLRIKDISLLVEGHIKEGYTFQDNTPIDEESPFYSRTPTEEDRVHCLVFVIDVNTLNFFIPKTTTTTDQNSTDQNTYDKTLPKIREDQNSTDQKTYDKTLPKIREDQISTDKKPYDKTLNKIHDINKEMLSKGIPIVLLLTKIDLLDEDVGANIKQMHGSATVEKAVKEASKIFGVDESNIFPIINFVKDIEIKPLASIPHILAMRHILGFARDCPINGADAHP